MVDLPVGECEPTVVTAGFGRVGRHPAMHSGHWLVVGCTSSSKAPVDALVAIILTGLSGHRHHDEPLTHRGDNRNCSGPVLSMIDRLSASGFSVLIDLVPRIE